MAAVGDNDEVADRIGGRQLKVAAAPKTDGQQRGAEFLCALGVAGRARRSRSARRGLASSSVVVADVLDPRGSVCRPRAQPRTLLGASRWLRRGRARVGSRAHRWRGRRTLSKERARARMHA